MIPPIPVSTILYLTGATAAKAVRMIRGRRSGSAESGDGDLLGMGLEIAGELSTVLFAHSFAEKIQEAKERFDRWLEHRTLPEQAALEKAVARCEVLADLYCLMAAAPGAPEGAEQVSAFRKAMEWRPEWLKAAPAAGFITQANLIWIAEAKSSCVARLDELDRHFESSGIRPLDLALAKDSSGAREITERAVGAWPGAPETVAVQFRERWFGYLQAGFLQERATNALVKTSFDSLLDELRFDRLIDAVGEVRTEVQTQADRVIRELGGRVPRPPGDPPPPPDPGDVIGRDVQIELATRMLLRDRRRPLLIWGPPGIGKSTIGLSVLHREEVIARFGARRFHARCDEFKDAAGLIAGLDRRWFGRVEAEPGRALLQSLSEGPGVVLLDNFESPWRPDRAGSERLVAQLLGIRDIWLAIALQGHERPGAFGFADLEPPPLGADDSMRLFRLAADLGPDIAVDPRLVGLVKEMEGVPHAIQLLGSQARFRNPADVESQWREESTRMLKVRGAAADDRVRSLYTAYELAVNNPWLDGPPRALLRVLACLPAGVALEDTAVVFAAGAGTDSWAADRASAELERNALAYRERGRLRMLAPLRRHVAGAGQRVAPEEMASALRFYLELGAKGEEVGGVSGGAVALKLAAEVENVHWAIGIAQAGGDPAMAAALGLAKFASFTGVPRAADPLEVAIVMARKAGDTRGGARGAERSGDIALARSDHAGARQRYEEALPLYRQVGDVLGEANCIQRLGDIALRRSDHAGARQRYEEALPLYRQVGAVLGEANCIKSLGNIALRRSDHARARQRYEEALPLYRQVGDVLGEANCIKSLGNIALERSDQAGARQRYEEALPLYRQVGAVLGEANCILSLGDIALERSDHAGARQRYEEALPLYRQVGAVLGEANCILSLGDIALERSDHAGARQRYEEALPLYRQVGDVLGEANCIRSLGDIALARSDQAGARQRYEEALPLYRQVGDVLGEANCIRSLGDIALARSDQAGARQRYEEALPLYRQVGAVQGEANCIRRLGDIALARSDHAGARRRYEEALPLYRQVGDVLGEANCILRLGDIALRRSDQAGAGQRYQEALPLYRQVGDVLGEANCIQSLGDIALRDGRGEEASERFKAALDLYRRISEPCSVGWTLRRLARMETDESKRAKLLAEAASLWMGSDRDDLVEDLRREFPGEV